MEDTVVGIIGLSQPILDVTVKVSEEVLDQNGLGTNDAVRSEELHGILLQQFGGDTASVEQIVSPGGSTTNTLRVANQILRTSCDTKQNIVRCIGCVGNDEKGDLYEKLLSDEGIKCLFSRSDLQTGGCLVLVSGHNRSLVTNIGAAIHLSRQFMTSTSVMDEIESATIYYLAGFSLSLPLDVVDIFLTTASSRPGNILVVNLSAAFICHKYTDLLTRAVRKAKYIFCNQDELKAFTKASDIPTDIDNIEDIAKWFIETNFANSSDQTLYVTRGENPVICISRYSEIRKVEVMETKDVKDTNGAGDAFVGGYLAQLALGASEDERLRCAMWTASVVLSCEGAAFPPDVTYRMACRHKST